MGNPFSKFFSRQKSQILINGLDAAGKSTILNQLKLGTVETLQIGIGYQQKKLETKFFNIFSWTIQGPNGIRLIWKHLYETSQALILVVDLTDKERMEEIQKWLEYCLIDNKRNNLPLLIYANKIDLAQFNYDDLVSELKFEKFSNNWHIQPCCAITREGLEDGITWILQQIK
ncbi:unnamed protein product (macronuclear) [Paramecium tetraurelia]|uniref:Arl_C07 protein n=1 Tax=Paramecium tetraurelia TaxID=5888 RepID=Q3SD51_PARTE|nr:uncharacterized protein GSPATT00035424001 [Paramecium tetraurelia]CAI44514.1 arl_C07 [Paramecium tetraurelia]CAK66295.1 unnamed protein product [Paramecium tetraurelia]|eukprot:XP_001433692.1 hypothetical protein (macronuclear) [Paramecium tetraurelia strain d4-2]